MSHRIDRVVLLTGAAGAIGSAIAHRLLPDPGTGLVLVDRNAEGLRVLETALGHPERVQTEIADITEPGDVHRMMAHVTERWGGVDVLINNAAYAYDESIIDTEPDRWDEQIDITLRSVYLCSRAVLPGMRARGRGVIVSMSSVNAHRYYGNEAYSAGKAAVESLMRSIAVRYGPDGIRALALGIGTVVTPGGWDARRERDPGLMDRLTTWYPLRRLGAPEDVAALVEFVSSDAASWITGTTIMIDGGVTAGSSHFADEVLVDETRIAGVAGDGRDDIGSGGSEQ